MNTNIKLICADDFEADNGRVYYISVDNRRHWIPTPEVAASYGWDLSTVIHLPVEKIYEHPLGFSIAKKYTNEENGLLLLASRCGGLKSVRAWDRQWFGSQFEGCGLELGAASAPWPCNLKCTVDYADSFDENEGCKIGYENKDFVPIDFKASLESMSGITKTDYNFIVCSHVIEHTPRVMLALKNVYEHLAMGGTFVMAVPHKEYTFDKYRQITPLSHHITDYEEYERSLDVIHLVDYLENAHIKYGGYTADITAHCALFLKNNQNFDMHYHVFNEESFTEIINWFNQNIYMWNSCEVFQRLEGSNEFFIRLIK